jgi:hypothetical protein
MKSRSEGIDSDEVRARRRATENLSVSTEPTRARGRGRLRDAPRQRVTRVRAWSRDFRERGEPASDPCAFGAIAICPFRAACDHEADAWHRAREGSREDFDALYESWFGRAYRIAILRLGNQALAESCTRDVLAVAFCLPAPLDGCAAAHILGLLAGRLGWEEEDQGA